MLLRVSIVSAFLLLSIAAFAQKTYPTFQVPGRAEFCRIDTLSRYPDNKSVLPSGRYVTPAGKVVRITNDPFGLTLSPDGKKTVTLHDGALTVLSLGDQIRATRVPDYAGKIPSPVHGATFLGVTFAPDSRTVYLSNGDKGRVIVFDTESLRATDSISLDGNGYTDSFTSDLLLNGGELLVLDRANFRLVRIDLATKKSRLAPAHRSIPTGRQPFGLAISADRKLAFVANVGLYEYPKVPGVTPTNKDTMMLKFPAYGAHTNESREGVEVEGRQIPGLGSPLADEAMSVWLVDLTTNKVVSKIKTGVQIGSMIEEAEVVGGSSPNSVVVGSRYAYVSNATNDNISIIDYRADRRTGKKEVGVIPLRVDPKLDRYRGLMPFGLTLTKDRTGGPEKTLYVALLAFNAVAVIDIPTKRVKGLIPTGWGPTRVVLSPDGKTIYVTSARGYGAGPNGGAGFVKPPQGTYIGDIQLGTFQTIPVPTASELAAYTKQVLANTYQSVMVVDDGRNPLPVLPGVARQKTRSFPIKHIVYITKENRTYDEVLGQLPTGRGDSTLARFGTNVTLTSRISTKRGAVGRTTDQTGDTLTVKAADVMPNHARLAQQFAFSDNFYCDSDASIHGHHWMMGTIPNEWVEANSASEGRFDPFSKAPGRRFPKSSGAIDPEDYNEIGGLWEALERSEVSFYNFGQVNEYAGNYEEQFDTTFGAAHPVVFPMPAAAFRHTSRNFAGFNCNIPDQFRMDQFEREFTAKWLPRGRKPAKEKLPQLITAMLPNDHGAGVRPDEGYPFLHSYMADNDLAVGRMLHFLSRTPYWKNMLVIITEDDPQGGVDHIDAHRSLLMLAGPYVKRGYVSHTHANFGSILKVIYNVLGVSYVNQYDQTASLLQDFFTDKPDFRPYNAVLPDVRVFDPQQAMKPYKKDFDWRKIQKGPEMDDRADQRAEHYRQQGK